MKEFDCSFLDKLREAGLHLKIVSFTHLPQLQKEIQNLCTNSLLDKQFFQERLTHFDFETPKELSNPRSIIVAALPRPQTRATFNWKGQKCSLILPPTYTDYDETTKRIENLIGEILEEKGFKFAEAPLPLKLLAARSGLVQYGKNNISYIPGLGSFFQLAAVYTDLSCEKDSWQEPKMMITCERCDLCTNACPTNAITSDRFLLHAERCITYHNEKKGEVPFPNWIKESSHNCIVGCMVCQKACPENKKLLNWIGEEEEFSEEETALILNGVPQDSLPRTTRKKLQHLSLADYYDRLPRNLSVFLKKSTPKN